MNTFTLHIRDDVHWRVLERFDDRESAIFMARQARNSQEYSGIKVLEDGLDQSTMERKKRAIFVWTTRTKEELADDNATDYMARIKQSRLWKEEQEKIRKRMLKERIKNASISALKICGFLGGIAILYILKYQ